MTDLIDHIKVLRASPSAPATTTTAFREQVLAALREGDVELNVGDGTGDGPHSLLMLFEDEEDEARFWLIADDGLSTEDRGVLDDIHGACFAWSFCADLKPEQWPSAMRFMHRLDLLKAGSQEDGIIEELAEEFDNDAELPQLDFTKRGDCFGGTLVDEDLGSIELTHFYCVQFGM